LISAFSHYFKRQFFFAANVLKKETGIESKTVKKHLMSGLQKLNKKPGQVCLSDNFIHLDGC
jgi:hypothetical protein